MFRRMGEVRIAQDLREIETALTETILRVDRQPAARAEMQAIAMMAITMQRNDVARIGQQLACDGGAFCQDATLNSGLAMQASRAQGTAASRRGVNCAAVPMPVSRTIASRSSNSAAAVTSAPAPGPCTTNGWSR